MFNFDEKTEKEIEGLCESLEKSAPIIEKKFKSLLNEFLDESWKEFLYFIENESNYSISVWIKRRVDDIISGNIKYLIDQSIISEYSWKKLTEIRIAIWESAGGETADSTIFHLLKENKELKRQLEIERKYRHESY